MKECTNISLANNKHTHTTSRFPDTFSILCIQIVSVSAKYKCCKVEWYIFCRNLNLVYFVFISGIMYQYYTLLSNMF